MPCSDATETGHGRNGSMAGGSELQSSAKWQLRCANERTERGKQHRSSQRVQRWPRRARGGTGARESSKVRRRPKVGGELEGDAAGLPEGRGSVGRKEGVEAELPGASVRLGVAGGRGYGERRRRGRSGVREGEAKERRRGRVRGSRGSGRRRRESPRRRGGEGRRQAGRWRVATARACAVSLLCLLAEVEDNRSS